MENKNLHINQSEHSTNHLNSIPKKNNFKTPENYFEKLESNLLETLSIKTESKTILKKPTTKIKQISITILAIAASLLLIFYYSIFEKSTSQSIEKQTILANYSINSFENELERNLIAIDTLLVADLENHFNYNNENDFTINQLEDIFNDENFY
jgi:hypothetical protein